MAAQDDLEAKLREEAIPERRQFIEVEAHRKTDLATGEVLFIEAFAIVATQEFVLEIVEIQTQVIGLLGNWLFATIAADKDALVVEYRNGKATFIVASLANR